MNRVLIKTFHNCRYEPVSNENLYEQPAIFWRRLLDDAGRQEVVDNIAEGLGQAQPFIQVCIFSVVERVPIGNVRWRRPDFFCVAQYRCRVISNFYSFIVGKGVR